MRYFILFLATLFILPAIAQTEQDTIAIDSAQFDEVRSLLSFYKYMLNTVGAAKTPTRDKEVIITESYKKIFNSERVQIEDDLILDRKVITNKDVNAYLRDVDFFFKEITFEFDSIQVQRIERGENDYFFLASFESIIEGTTIEGDTLIDTKERFLEVNIDQAASDLKIVSVYSTKTSRTQELQSWWAELSFGWINIFKNYVDFDTMNNEVLKKIASIDSIDISGNQFILSIEPLAALRDLRAINLSNTKISDLSPLRYSRGLRKLNISNSTVTNLAPLQYFENLNYLDLAQTGVEDISTLSRLQELRYLNLSNSRVLDFGPLQSLSNLRGINFSNTSFSRTAVLKNNSTLENVDLSRTSITNLNSFSNLKSISELDLSETKIQSLQELESHPMLRILVVNQTNIASLDPLLEAPKLEKIYADNTEVTEAVASTFMSSKPETVVVANSEQIMQWWDELPANWKVVFSEVVRSPAPSKEDIIKFLNCDSLNLSGKSLKSIEPLKKFKRLRYLNVDDNLFESFEFTEAMVDLEFLSGKKLPTETTLGLEKNLNLRYLILTGSSIQDIRPLSLLNKLESINADNTGIDETTASNYLATNPKTVIIYRSDQLKDWWTSLSLAWKETFGLTQADGYALHELTQKNEISISNPAINSLMPLQLFSNLEKISLDKVKISSLNEVFVHEKLKSLACTNAPLQSISGITRLQQLEYLDVSNTAIEGLRELSGLKSLKKLNCSGTGIKNLRGLEELTKMEQINFSSTRVWKLDHLYGMRKLKSLICNNTRLRDHTVEDFKTAFPDCEVTFY